jgi:hypothetical protein
VTSELPRHTIPFRVRALLQHGLAKLPQAPRCHLGLSRSTQGYAAPADQLRSRAAVQAALDVTPVAEAADTGGRVETSSPQISVCSDFPAPTLGRRSRSDPSGQRPDAHVRSPACPVSPKRLTKYPHQRSRWR